MRGRVGRNVGSFFVSERIVHLHPATSVNICSIMAKQKTSANPRGNPKNKTGENKHQFTKGYDPRRNYKGAPPKPTRLAVLEKAFGNKIEPEFEKSSTVEILRYLCEITPAELRVLSTREDLAAFVIAYAKRIIHAIDHNQTEVLEEIYNRAYGKPTSKVAITDSNGDDKEGGIFIFLPDNGREGTQTEQNSVHPTMNKKESKSKKTK